MRNINCVYITKDRHTCAYPIARSRFSNKRAICIEIEMPINDERLFNKCAVKQEHKRPEGPKNTIQILSLFGRLAERSIAADCKSVP